MKIEGAMLLTLGALALAAFTQANDEPYSGIQAEMRARGGLADQVESWNRGDLEAALGGYCPSADITWVNKAGVTRGYEGFARSMREGFGGGRARMGRLRIDVLDSRSLAENKALVALRWSIRRGGKRVMGGVSTQLWAWCDNRMRIVFEHAS
jgi:hypothetical protein